MADQKLARYSALLSGSELFLGSLVHGIKIPLGGHALSLIQLGLLSQLELVTRSSPDTLFFPWLSSNIAASLKTLSPAGKKLTPMLAISMQGFLFNLGQFFLGRNLLGALLGAVALSVWAFLQPLFFAWVYFGEALTKGLDKVLSEVESAFPSLSAWLLYAVVALVVLKVCVAIFVVLWVNFSGMDAKDRILMGLERKLFSKASSDNPVHSEAIESVAIPKGLNLTKSISRKVYFLYALAFAVWLVSLIFVQSSIATKIWWALRPLGAYFAIWLLLKWFPLETWPKRAEKYFPSFSKGLHATLSELSPPGHQRKLS